MRLLTMLVLLSAPLFVGTAMADDAEGKIVSINEDAEVMTLDDGKEYRLPGEFDYSSIEKGMRVLLTFDLVNKVRYITDIEDSQ